MTLKTFYFYLTSILLFFLTWAHAAPQVYSYSKVKKKAEQGSCGVDFTFYLTELEFVYKKACSEKDRERIEQMLMNN